MRSRTSGAKGKRAASRYARMTRLVVSSDQAYIAGINIALDASCIPHLDQPIGAPWMPTTAVLVRELDLRRAKEAIREVQLSASTVDSRPVRFPMAVILLLVLVAIAIGVVSVVGQLFHN